ncbi:hypothetical protein [Chromobacterium sphagni]|uniref:Uncharacterized protein n=1 Tax=Chromobacterium sphagni TaxID=1903179 RepID=A0ABX3CBQ0_9NEIS|nr:hypothetical protein [Chromobacterium sphagni]OHX19557.1 hypothetical protein BI344_17790 [Chromobacterium sphagni]
MSLQNLSCAVLNDLCRHLSTADRDERLALAVEHEADMMLTDIECARGMGASFMDLLLSGAPAELMGEMHLYLGQQLLRRVFDRTDLGPHYDQLARAARAFVDASAAAVLDEQVSEQREAA